MDQQQQLRRRRHASSDSQPTAPERTSTAGAPEPAVPETFEAMMWNTLQIMLFTTTTFAANLFPIGDCDEVYNYWEPTHYLLYGSGMQTWEYSPAYGLRSYLYVGLHALLGAIIQPMSKSAYPLRYRTNVFFMIRQSLAMLHCFVMLRFASVIRKKIGFFVSGLTLFIAAVSPGLLQASMSYLPQSFAMYAVTMAFAAFMEGTSSFGCVFWMGVAGLIGWPFVGILAICLAAPLVYRHGAASCFKAALFTTLICLIPSLLIDYYYYRKWSLPVLNIIKYNAFTSHGANLYGVEPWHYYFRNLSLNFSVSLLGFLLVFPLSAAIWLRHRNDNSRSKLLFNKENDYKSDVISTSKKTICYLWPTLVFLAVFLSMVHKEERFLYPIYPLIAFGAASFFYLIGMSGLFSNSPRLVTLPFILIFILLSISRSLSVVSNYAAPMVVFSAIPPQNAKICIGKEWYRFPSSFFLPTADSELLYLRSDFSGLLPRPFSRESNGTRVIPPGMNDLNEQELDRYSDISRCDFVVDLDLPHQKEVHFDQLPDFTLAYKIRFLDASRTPWFCRAFYFPGFSEQCRVDGTYQLLKRITPK